MMRTTILTIKPTGTTDKYDIISGYGRKQKDYNPWRELRI